MKETFKEYVYDGVTYKVSNYGRVFGKKGELKQRLNPDGYLEVTVGKLKGGRTSRRVHRIVAETFLPNPNNLPEVNHKDYNRANPRLDNLEWTDRVTNIRYSSDKGRYRNNKRGSKNGRAKLTNDQVVEIRKLFKSGVSIYRIAKDYNAGWSTISHIVKGETWTHM